MNTVRGLFIGLSTIDVQYKIDRFPAPNTKLNAAQFSMQPGGPAYNAAVTFSFLGGDATVVSVIGEGSLASFVRHDADLNDVALQDAKPMATELPVSSILVEAANGNRTIIYNSHKVEGLDPISISEQYDIILVDGFYPELAVPILSRQAGQATVVFDGDVWNDGSGAILPFVDIAICSENFAPPGTTNRESVLQAIREIGPACGAFTRGERSIIWFDDGESGEIDVRQVDVVDTLGAGDIFHGAFCYHYAATKSFKGALANATTVSAISCKSFGTRTWMTTPEAQKLKP